jgi:hypothetical protein
VGQPNPRFATTLLHQVEQDAETVIRVSEHGGSSALLDVERKVLGAVGASRSRLGEGRDAARALLSRGATLCNARVLDRAANADGACTAAKATIRHE